MVNKMKKKVVLCIGDWSVSNRGNLKGLASTPHIGLRRMLAKHMLVLTVPEHSTTKTCFACEGENAPCLWRDKNKVRNSRDTEPSWMEIKEAKEKNIKWREVHGLRKCSNTSSCGVYLSRDPAASKNILKRTLKTLRSKGLFNNTSALYNNTCTHLMPCS
jgi:transposase